MERKPKILIAEDNPDSRELFALVLKRSGFDVIEATTGQEAMILTHTTLPDLIVMDLSMPRLSGDQATVQLKADPLTKHIPILICTAFTNGEPIERAVAAGAVEVLHKPVQLLDLAQKIRQHLPTKEEVCLESTRQAA
jgi:CheY-like chemotaxis protein